VTAYICVTCGTQFPPSSEPPAECPICLDERQYVGEGGQRWTTLADLRRKHRARIEEVESNMSGVGVEPPFAIGQRALLVQNLLWDCVALVDDEIASAVEAHGGLAAIAISHPHYYTAMVEWAERFDARILLHEADREWVMRPSPRIEFWSGERYRISDALELIRLGGHFAGGTVCLWHDGASERGTLLSGDIIQVVADRDWVSFMWSYPNLIPLPAAEVERIRDVVESLTFDRLYGAWWDRVIPSEAKPKVLRSADRYLDAISRGRGHAEL
jgi:glyoxylase-like metal-dependent hydrolase (beta-lactamase superfamily II)